MGTKAKTPTSKTFSRQETNLLQIFLQIGGSLLIMLVMLILLMTGIGSSSFRDFLFVTFGLLGLIIAGAVFMKPEVGAYILIFTIFTNFSDVLGVNGLPGVNKPLVAVVTIGLFLGNYFRERRDFRVQRSELLLIAFGVVSALTFLVARDGAVVVDWSVDFAKDIVILMSIVFALRTRASWKRASWILILSAALIALLGLYQVLFNDYSTQFFGLATVHFDSNIAGGIGAARLEGPIDDPNFFGQMMVAVLPLALYRAFDERTLRTRVLATFAAMLIGFAVIFSYSRGAFLALIFVLVFILFSRVKSWSWRVIALSLAILLFTLLPSSYTARQQTLLAIRPADQTTLYQDNSLRGRSSEVQAGILMWQDHPIMGVGAENYTVHYQEYAQQIGLEYRSEDREAHSLYIQILAETGLLGIGIFSSFLIVLFLSSRQSLHRLRSAPDGAELISWIASIRVGIAAYLVSSIFLHGDYFRYLILIIALAIAANHLVERDFTESSLTQHLFPAASP